MKYLPTTVTKTYIGKILRQTKRRIQEHEKDATKAAIYLSQTLGRAHPIKHHQQAKETVQTSRVGKKYSSQPLGRSSRLFNKQLISNAQNP